MRASNTEASNLSADILLIFRLYGIHIILALPYHISKQQPTKNDKNTQIHCTMPSSYYNSIHLKKQALTNNTHNTKNKLPFKTTF